MVKMSQQPDLSPTKTGSVKGFTINPLDIAKYLLGNWYWFALSVAIFGGFQWYRYATTQCEYRTNATVMFKDARANAQMAGLDRLASAAPAVNVSNEILQFMSPQLMTDAVQRLNADVSYEVMDYLRVKELYSKTPVKITFIDADAEQQLSLQVTVNDANHAILSDFSIGDSKPLMATFGKTVSTPLGKLKVTKTLSLNQDWFGKSVNVVKRQVSTVVNRLCSNLHISQAEADASTTTASRMSSILNMQIQDVSPERAADVLNMLITIYNEENIKDKNQVAVNTSDFINERLQIIEKELGGVEQKIQEYKQANDMIDVASAANISSGQKEQYTTQAKDLMLQARLGQNIKDYLIDPSKETDLIPANTGIADANIEAQIAQYNTTKLRRDKLLEGSSEKNPVVEDMNKALHSMRQSIIRSVDNMNVNTNVKLREISSRAGQASARVAAIPRQQRQMLTIERQQNIKQELYLYLLNKREENALSLATTESNARVLQPAHSNETVVSPLRQQMVMKGVLAGLALPAAILLFILFFDTSIKSRKDIEDATTVPWCSLTAATWCRRHSDLCAPTWTS